MWRGVTIVWLSLVLIVCSAFVEGKEIYIGDIELDVTAHNVCNALEDGDVVVLRTNGGSVDEGHALVECIRDKDVILKVVKAYSAGVFVVFGAKKVCLATGVSVGTHSPYSVWPNGNIRELSVREVRNSLARWGKNLIKQGYAIEDVFYLLGLTFMTPSEEMSRIRVSTLKRVLGDRYLGNCGTVL